jgi:hypothetical protein
MSRANQTNKSELDLPQGKKGQEFTKRLPPVEVHNVRDAKRLLSRLITQLQNDEVEDKKAKSICYLLQTYVNITKEYEIEERLRKIEEAITNKGNT